MQEDNFPASDIVTIYLDMLELSNLVEVLYDGLKSQFEQVKVEMVNCPDLRLEPFNLTAPGLCGNESIVDIGGVKNLYMSGRNRIHILRNILACIGRQQSDTLIIGASVCPRYNVNEIGELIMNASYSSENMQFWNQSHIGFVEKGNSYSNTFMLEKYNDPNPICSTHGSLFFSDGSPGIVLKVYAAKRIGNVDFIRTMQDSLHRTCIRMGYANALIGLGGTFLVRNAKVKFHIIPNTWSHHPLTEVTEQNQFYNYHIEGPMVAVGTFFNTDSWFGQLTSQTTPIKLHFTEHHFHAVCEGVAGGHFHTDVESDDTVEYIGYFQQARKFHLIDPMPLWISL